MAPRGASCSCGVAAYSERVAGIDGQRELLGRVLTSPGALDLWAVDEPELVAQQLEALEDGERLPRRPVRGGLVRAQAQHASRRQHGESIVERSRRGRLDLRQRDAVTASLELSGRCGTPQTEALCRLT